MTATRAGTGGEVRLVDLDVIKRYSLAVRQEWAPAEEVLAVLEATRDAVLEALGLEQRALDEAAGDDVPPHDGQVPVPRSARRRTARRRA